MICDVKNLLDIFIITYNRCKKLKSTLEQLLEKNSPVKNFSITIIDNNSTDSTSQLIKNFQSKHTNLIYIKNHYNIGANANIVKAFYKASKDYVWVLADNDSYDWCSWREVEEAIKQARDGVVVATYEHPSYDVAQLFLQTSFLPGVIYKRSNIDDTVMGNMTFNIANMFPHLALSAKLLNEHKSICIIKQAIVNIGDNRDEDGNNIYTRGYNQLDIHPLQKDMDWITGYANSLYMIKDKKIRNYVISHNRFLSRLNSAKVFFLRSKHPLRLRTYNILCIFSLLPLGGKIKFLLNLVLSYSLYRILFIYKEEVVLPKGHQLKITYKIMFLSYFVRDLFSVYQTKKGVYL
ncbi:glycosyltransferase family 2 protein [Helicobacter sp. 11S02629-2]|uniref:glycosyltransferase family 2 protein n=1 Tax=Helicobacter sp. 11S02629-2 TaxID=1476195 RepID=UPI000BA7510B|nr:glycosyltransferase family 2 protein [Helicobacter sp. 11S02629-2]PAF44660.1 hypothetical protein BKH40_05380 [Helicobacter sp. 11S02629-2]